MAKWNATPNVAYPKHPVHFLEPHVDPPCAQVGFPAFFPEKGDNMMANRAKQICNSNCPVRNECFEYAINLHVDGIWAGTTDRERSSYRATHGIVAHSMNMEEFLPPLFTPEGERVSEKTLHMRGIETRHYG